MHARVETQLGRRNRDASGHEVLLGGAASDGRRLTPEPQRIAIGDFLARFGHDRIARPIEPVRNSYSVPGLGFYPRLVRSEERPVGQESVRSVRPGWSPDQLKKKTTQYRRTKQRK